MARIKSRLSIRLAIVGVVLAVGVAAIYYSVTSRNAADSEQVAEQPDDGAAAEAATAAPKPIPSGETEASPDQEPLRPPSASMFADEDAAGDEPAGNAPAGEPTQPAYQPPYGSRYAQPTGASVGTAQPAAFETSNASPPESPVPLAADSDEGAASPARASLNDSTEPTADGSADPQPAATQLPADPLAAGGGYGPPADPYAAGSTGPGAATPPTFENTAGNTPSGTGTDGARAADSKSDTGSSASFGADPSPADASGFAAGGSAPPSVPRGGFAGPGRGDAAGLGSPAAGDGTASDVTAGGSPTGQDRPTSSWPAALDSGSTADEPAEIADNRVGAPDPSPSPSATDGYQPEPAAADPESASSPSGVGSASARGALGSEPASSAGRWPGQSPGDRAGQQSGSAGLSGLPAGSSPVEGAPEDVPGDRRWEGQQAPVVTVEKSAPDEIQVNRKAMFRLHVRNTGTVAAHNVVVTDRVPRGTTLVNTTPAIQPAGDGVLVWQLDTLQPGKEVTLAMEVLPQMEGEIGSVAEVTFQTKASVRSICTRPVLTLEQTLPEQVLIGQPALIQIVVSNTGTGTATNVVLEEDVPEGLTHAAGPALEHVIGTLPPGKSVELSLVLNAAKPGVYENKMTVRGDGDLQDESISRIEVTAPQLQVGVKGPSRRFLDREATYSVEVAKAGTAAAQNIQLVAHLPQGMKYVTSDNEGHYDAQSHAVYWNLQELAPNRLGEVHVTILPLEAGDQKLTVESKADLGLSHSVEHQIQVERTAELVFTIRDQADPIEVGSRTSYEIRLRNQGTKADTNIQLAAQLPAGLEPVGGDGPTQATVQGQQVQFDSLARLAPGEEVVFQIQATGGSSGNHVVRVQLQSDALQVPVGKEESTRVYADR